MKTDLSSAEQELQYTPPPSGLWFGRIMAAFTVLFLLVDAVMKLIKPPPVVQATVDLGYPESRIIGLGIVLLACVVLYVIPKTSLLGAILLTGYLGGAVATHVRVGSPLFTHTLFPVYLGALVWGGLFLRDPRMRMLIVYEKGSQCKQGKISPRPPTNHDPCTLTLLPAECHSFLNTLMAPV
jgi:hypothetical protein